MELGCFLFAPRVAEFVEEGWLAQCIGADENMDQLAALIPTRAKCNFAAVEMADGAFVLASGKCDLGAMEMADGALVLASFPFAPRVAESVEEGWLSQCTGAD
ncbi:MAG: hypothetical protein LBP65_01950 [Puniceicoccales bacterium]|nr:hypothetical protein [Puniceicoccales bacterium]